MGKEGWGDRLSAALLQSVFLGRCWTKGGFPLSYPALEACEIVQSIPKVVVLGGHMTL